MTPKEKAQDLYNNFADTLPDAVEISHQTIKYCALLAVDEILNAGKDVDEFADAYW